MTLAELSIRRPITVAMFFTSVIVFGAIAAGLLKLERFPSFEVPFIGVNIPYPGSSPKEVERDITRPVEEALATLSDVDTLWSSSSSEGAQIFIWFGWGKNIDAKTVEVRERIDAIRAELPTDIQRITFFRFNSASEPVLRIRLSSTVTDLRQSYELIERRLKRPLERVPGVASVSLAGIAPDEVYIELLPERIAAHGIDLPRLAQQLQAINFSTSAGVIRDGPTRFRVQPVGELTDLEQLRDVVIDARGLRLRDVADVHLQPRRIDERRILNGSYAVGIDVQREPTANLVEVGRAAMEVIRQVQASNALPGIEIIVVNDQAKAVTSSLRDLLDSGIFGALFAVLVLYFFLRHLPSTLAVALAVPICLTMTLGVMYALGLTLNVLSMMGLLLAVGMLVDNAVVVVESIYQEQERNPGQNLHCAVVGTRRVALAVTTGTLTSIAVFLPLMFSGGTQISLFFYYVAMPLTIALSCSWLVAVSLIPTLAARVAPPKGIAGVAVVESWKRRYADLIAWTLRHPKQSYAVIALSLLAGVLPMTQVKTDFFGADEEREINFRYDLKGSYTLDEVEAAWREVERFLLANKERFEIEQTYAYLGSGGFGGGNVGLAGWLELTPQDTRLLASLSRSLRRMLGRWGLVDRSAVPRTVAEIKEEIRRELPKVAIGEPSFDGMRGPRGGGGNEGNNDLRLRLTGDSLEVLDALARDLLPLLSRVEGLTDVRLDSDARGRELRVRIDRARAAAYGFTAQQIAQIVALALRGQPLREFRHGEQEVPTTLRFKDADRLSLDTLQQVRLTRPNGDSVPLSAVVEIESAEAARTIDRENRQTGLAIVANRDRALSPGEARTRVEEVLKAVAFPPGYGYDWGRSFDQEQDAAREMVFSLLLAMVLVVIVMAALFESTVYPFIIISGFFFSITGVYWGYWIVGTTFSVMSFIGIMILMGVVVNNGIVLIEHVNTLRRQGVAREQALIQAGAERLRPILITMGTTILGLLPLCVSTAAVGGDGPPYSPMAQAIAFGLVFSTVVSLWVLPTLYVTVDEWTLRLRRRIRDDLRRLGSPTADPAALRGVSSGHGG